MTDRNLFDTMWLACSLALLSTAVVEPAHSSSLVTVTSRAECLRRCDTSTPDHLAPCLCAAIATEDVVEMDALLFEEEEQCRAEALVDSQLRFFVPSCFPQTLERPSISARTPLTLYRLRC